MTLAIHIELIGFVLGVIPVRHLIDFNVVTHVALKMPLLPKIWPGMTRNYNPFPLATFRCPVHDLVNVPSGWIPPSEFWSPNPYPDLPEPQEEDPYRPDPYA